VLKLGYWIANDSAAHTLRWAPDWSQRDQCHQGGSQMHQEPPPNSFATRATSVNLQNVVKNL